MSNKLSNHQVDRIREATLEGKSSRQIAESEELSQSMVARLIKGRGWQPKTVIGKDGKKRKGRRIKPNYHPAEGECGICDDPECPGHLDELEAPEIELIGCWCCSRKGTVGPRGHVPCTICSGVGWMLINSDDRFPSNRYGVAEMVETVNRLKDDGYAEDIGWVVAKDNADEQFRNADWEIQEEILGPRTVTKASTVKRDWRGTGDLKPTAADPTVTRGS